MNREPQASATSPPRIQDREPSQVITPPQARARGSLTPHAEVAIVPGSHGGFNRIDELNDRIAAFIEATVKQAGSTGSHRRLNGRRRSFPNRTPHPPLPPGWVLASLRDTRSPRAELGEKRLSSSRGSCSGENQATSVSSSSLTAWAPSMIAASYTAVT